MGVQKHGSQAEQLVGQWDRPDIQHAVRVCSKSAANPTTHDWLKLKRIGRNVTGCPEHQNHVCLAKGTTNV